MILLVMAALIAAAAFHGQHLSLLAAALALLVCGAALSGSCAVRRGGFLPVSAAFALLLGLWSWFALSAIWSEVPYLSALGLWWFGALPLAALVVVLWQPEMRDWRRLSTGIAIVGVVLVVWQLTQGASQSRPPGPYLNPNSLAAWLNLALLGTLGGAGSPRRPRELLRYLAAGLMVLGVALVGSRGAYLGLATGLAVLLGVLFLRRDRVRLSAVAVSVIAGVTLGEVLTGGLGGERLASLVAPGDAGSTRFLIWESAWQMFLERPWLGWGLGTFWLAYPPFRQPADASGGFYVHNDYLQFAVETGLPGFLLAVAWSLSLVWLGWRFLRQRLSDDAAPQVAGMMGGLLAVGVHTLFTFNFYILSILVLAGLYLGRVLQLAAVSGVVKVWRPRMPGWSTIRGCRLIIWLLAALPLLHFTALAGARWQMHVAKEQAAQGEIVEADQRLQRVLRLMPGQDAAHLARAGLLLELLSRAREAPEADRQALRGAAAAALEAAGQANPLRPDVPLLQARLALAAPGERRSPAAERAFRRALALDPLHLESRLAYAIYLLERAGAEQEARELLEAGAAYHYAPYPRTGAYYQLLGDVRRAQGEHEAAQRAYSRASEVRAAFERQRAKHEGSFRLLDQL